MLQRADIAGARPVLLVEATTPATASGDAQQEAFDRLTLLQLGKEFQAQVLSRLTDGSYLVKIDDAVAGMKLPAGTKAGDIVDLTLLATEPRPTFLLGKADTGSTASLSPAARLLTNILQLAQQDGSPPTTLVGKTPLIATPDAAPADLAGALQHAVSSSGLFYESHLAQWAGGTRTLAELLNEPLVKLLSAQPASMPDKTGQSVPDVPVPQSGRGALPLAHLLPADIGRLLHSLKEQPAGEQRSLLNILRELKTGGTSLQPDNQMQSDSQASVDGTTGTDPAKLISLQLDTLEQRRIMWQGELFPGLPIEWEISDETPNRSEGDREAPDPAWQSVVRFSLPTLGTISASVRLTGTHVQVNVRTASEDSAAALRIHSGVLADALDAAGSTLDSLLVRHDG